MTISEQIIRAKADYDEVFEAGKRSVEATLKFTDVASNSYRITVPNNVEPFAKVNKIGGMTHKTRNKIPFPYYFSSPQTTKGITITTSDSGAITINGTSDAEGVFFLVYNGTTTHLNGTYTLSGLTNGSATTYYIQPYIDGQSQTPIYTASRTYTWNGTLTILGFYFKAGISFNNLTIYPMLNEGSTALAYEPYFEGLRSASVSGLKSEFGNLFNYDNIIDKFKGTGENVGKIWVNATGYSANFYTGTTGGSVRVPREYWDKLMYLTKGTYYAYYEIDFYENEVPETDRCIQARAIHLNGEDFWCGQGGQKLFSGGSFTMYQDGYCYLRSVENKRCYISNLMITRTPRTEYVPYKPDILPIHEEVKNLDGYGLGVNSEYYSYIDFERKVFVPKVHRKVFDGTENIKLGSSGTGHIRYAVELENPYTAIDDSNSINVICNHYPATNANRTYGMFVDGFAASNTYLWFVDTQVQTGNAEDMRTKLKAWYDEGNPLIVDYILAEPIETDISSYLTDKYIEVEGGGTITAVNEYGLDAPTNISYLIDTQGG